jgi:hypothetical protein
MKNKKYIDYDKTCSIINDYRKLSKDSKERKIYTQVLLVLMENAIDMEEAEEIAVNE